MASNADLLLKAALQYTPSVIWFSFGNFSPYVNRIRSECPTTKIFAQVTTCQEALTAVGYGADVIVVQGLEVI